MGILKAQLFAKITIYLAIVSTLDYWIEIWRDRQWHSRVLIACIALQGWLREYEHILPVFRVASQSLELPIARLTTCSVKRGSRFDVDGYSAGGQRGKGCKMIRHSRRHAVCLAVKCRRYPQRGEEVA